MHFFQKQRTNETDTVLQFLKELPAKNYQKKIYSCTVL
ncbi:UNVERIFIED_ORG: hypothetical protein [Escherichia phage CMSTMSU]